MSKKYTLNLPVYKQGDDLSHCLEHAENTVKAFQDQAKLYESAAKMCSAMAEAFEKPEFKEVTVHADGHMIQLEYPEDEEDVAEMLEELVDDEILSVEETDDEEIDDAAVYLDDEEDAGFDSSEDED